MHLDKIYIKLDIKYYKALRDYLNKTNQKYNWLDVYINELIESIKDEKLSETFIEGVSKVKLSKTDSYNQIFDDQTLYKRPWTKLNTIHKILKIQEFVKNTQLNFKSDEERNKLKDELIELIKNKTLTKKENINYSETEGRIINIPNLQCKDGIFSYSID